MSEVSTFNPLAELPNGPLMIEASAGTGKTYTLSSLATRLVVEQGLPIGRLLMVTFSRSAAAELRSRVRLRLLAAAADFASGETTDPLFATLMETDRLERLGKLQRAVSDFDDATITTIHGFAQLALSALGVGAPIDLDASLDEDSATMIAQVTSDLLTNAALDLNTIGELPGQTKLNSAIQVCLSNTEIDIIPDGPVDPSADLFVSLVREGLQQVEVRRRRAGTLAYDDLLTQLRAGIDDADNHATLASLQSRYEIALIDEFQDTDPVQWAIFNRLFGGSEAMRLVLVGDPKQAIYTFRGANVHTYLGAKSSAQQLLSLDTNWRSDGVVLAALEQLFSGVDFAGPIAKTIQFRPVLASTGRQHQRATAEDGTPMPALRFRLITDPDLRRYGNGKREVLVPQARDAVHADVASTISRTLSETRLPTSDGSRRVNPSDMAVLVRRNAEAAPLRAQLAALGIPAVINRVGHVTDTLAARQVRILLDAVARPSNATRARALALSWFDERTIEQLAVMGDEDLGPIHEALHSWQHTLSDAGVNAFFARVWSHTKIIGRVLGLQDGERNVTDLDQLIEILQEEASGPNVGIAGLIEALDRLEASTKNNEVEALLRRLESDDDAVQIMTVHSAKGLEFPIVCYPYGWNTKLVEVREVTYQDPQSERRTYDLANGAKWPNKEAAAERKSWAQNEQIGEDLRLMYVALTRAQHQVIVWWAGMRSNTRAALDRVLWSRSEDGSYDSEISPMPPSDADAVTVLKSLIEKNDLVSVEEVPPSQTGEPYSSRRDARGAVDLDTATFERDLDRHRSRWSFTGIQKLDDLHGNDPQDDAAGERGAEDELRPPDEDNDGVSTLPLGNLIAGARFGTAVHSILEDLDFAEADLRTELIRRCANEARFSDSIDATELADGLMAAVETPLGDLFDNKTLREIPLIDRIDEMAFDLPLGSDSGAALVNDIGALLRRHIGADDPMGPWARTFAAARPRQLKGHLTGLIDSVVRVGPADTPRFVVVDYKTNRLARPGRPTEAADYQPDSLARSMADHDYLLQALLYSAALHRFLRWRLPSYDPEVNMGGIAYLYLRGMAGPKTPIISGVPNGVFEYRPKPELVVELSDLLAGVGASA